MVDTQSDGSRAACTPSPERRANRATRRRGNTDLPLGAPSTKISVVDDADVLRAFVRGEVSTDALAGLGYNLTSEVGGPRLDAPVSEGVELPLADLAAGLLRQLALGTALREWRPWCSCSLTFSSKKRSRPMKTDCWTPCGPRLRASPFLTMP